MSVSAEKNGPLFAEVAVGKDDIAREADFPETQNYVVGAFDFGDFFGEGNGKTGVKRGKRA